MDNRKNGLFESLKNGDITQNEYIRKIEEIENNNSVSLFFIDLLSFFFSK